jgi:SAM-dependent methyltransferase
MSQDTGFIGSIPQIYDEHIGPSMMIPYAEDLARRLSDVRGSLLEIAAGTGIVTIALAKALPHLDIVATDLNQPMLDHAAKKPELAAVKFQQADALNLPFEDESFDAVVCQFGVMFFPDKPAAFREAHRILKPGGRFLLNVWGSATENPIIDATLDGLRKCYPKHASWFLERTPCGYRDEAVIRADLRAGGFGNSHIQPVMLRGRAESAMAVALGLCQGSPEKAELESLDPDNMEAATRAAADAIASRYGNGPFETELRALVVETARN